MDLSPIRVLHVVSSMDRAGQETLIMNLYRNIDRSKVQFDFLCTSVKKGDFEDEIISLGGIIHHLLENKIKIPHLHNLESIYNYKKFFANHPEYQIVHFHNYHAYSVLIQIVGAKLGHVKDILIHSHNTSAPNPTIHKLAKPIINIFRISRLACSVDAGRWMFGGKKFQVIKNGIDLSKYKYNENDRRRIREQLGISENEKVICHIGRFNYQKNHKRLLHIFNEVLKNSSDYNLLLIGKGELENEIKCEIDKLGITDRVRMLGVRSDISSILSASDVFLFPSLFEGLSVVLVEAQANGIPIICSDVNTDEGIFVNNIAKLSLTLDNRCWGDKIIEYSGLEHSCQNEILLQNAGFDIKSSTKTLLMSYLFLCK